MRIVNFLLGLMLIALSPYSLADWSRFADDGAATIYVDTATLKRAGEIASVWILKDYRQMQVGSSREKFKSVKIFYEFKCSEKLGRQSYLTQYYGPMGGAGSLPSDSRFHPWIAIVPETERAQIFEFACKYR